QRQVRAAGAELAPARGPRGDDETQRFLAGRREQPAEMHAGLETRNDGGEGATSDRVERHVSRAGQADGKGTGGIGAGLEADERTVLEPPRLEAAVRGARRRHRPEQELRPG